MRQLAGAYRSLISTTHVANLERSNATVLAQCQQFASGGGDLIVLASAGFDAVMLNCSVEFQDKHFLVVGGDTTTKNLNAAFARMYELRYLTGVIAGMMYSKVGYVAAYPIAQVQRGINAFALGVRSVNPKATIHVAYTSTWLDPDTERKAAEFLILNHSVEMIAQHQDGVTPQLVAQEHGLTSMGYDSDMALQVGDSVLVSPQFEWAKVYSYFIDQLLECRRGAQRCTGGWKGYERYWPGSHEGALSLSQLSWKVTTEAKAELLRAESEFVNKHDELVFCGPAASNKLPDMPPQLADGQCLDDDAMWGMAYHVRGVHIEASFRPAPQVTCKLGQRLDIQVQQCISCDSGYFSSAPRSTACTSCQPGGQLGGQHRRHMYLCSHTGGAGYFQPEQGQFGCLSCDSLGDFFQEAQARTSCQACAANTRRFVGVLSAMNRSSCQCKEGVPSAAPRHSVAT